MSKQAKKMISKIIRPYPELNFEMKMQHYKIINTGEESLMSKDITLIKKYRKEMLKEQFGNHIKKNLKSIDSWRRLDDQSNSLLGEAPKGILLSTNNIKFLYKEPKVKPPTNHGFKESMTELIISEISKYFVPAAEVSLALYKNKIVLLSKIFLKSEKSELIHGDAIFHTVYDKEGIDEVQNSRVKQRSFYTLEHIIDVFKQTPIISNINDKDHIIDNFCGMILTDCFTGNQDRHAQNWGLIRDLSSNSFKFSPLYDNARGLFWNTSILQMAQKVHDNHKKFIDDYINESKPMISLNSNPNASHFDLIKELTHIRPKIVGQFMVKLGTFDISSFIMRFRPMMSPLRYSVIVELLEKRRKRIYEELI